jgi:PncC family amidohydrolase
LKLRDASRELARWLRERHFKIVFAESCTAGLASAALARVPGISDHLCGSAVAYRNETKVRWLRVSRRTLDGEGAVSAEVAQQMAAGVLRSTPEADFSAAVTGHLGPLAPPEQDGIVYVAVGRRGGREHRVDVWRFRLRSKTRWARQQEAAWRVLQRALRAARSGL